MSDTKTPIDVDDTQRAEPTPPQAPRWAAGHVIIAVVIALSLGALLNAAALHATAQRQPFGPMRDASVAITDGLVTVAGALRLDVPRERIDVALGRGPTSSDEPVGEAPAGDPPVAAAEEAAGDQTAPRGQDEAEGTEEPGVEDAVDSGAPGTGAQAGDEESGRADGDEAEPADGAEGADGTDTPAWERGPVTAQDPLTMYIGGDSLVGQFGMALEDLADDTGVIETTEVVYEFGSGLSRPDFIDWPARLRTVSEEQDPDVIVLYFGGNDAQPLEIDGVVREPEDEEWQQEYRSRVSALMTQIQEAGHRVYWMGMPIPRDAKLDARYRMLNEIYSSEADAHDAVTFVPAWDTFAGEDGNFSEYLPNQNGDVVDMRLDDGIHYTTAGAYRIARVAIAQVIEDHGIEPA